MMTAKDITDKITELSEAEEERWVYGTRDKKWHLVGKDDRDFANGITQKDFKKLGKEKAKKKYLGEAKKTYKEQPGIGKAKYTVSFHNGKKKHKDGSNFYDIKILKNKKDLAAFIDGLKKDGYVEEKYTEADGTVADLGKGPTKLKLGKKKKKKSYDGVSESANDFLKPDREKRLSNMFIYFGLRIYGNLTAWTFRSDGWFRHEKNNYGLMLRDIKLGKKRNTPDIDKFNLYNISFLFYPDEYEKEMDVKNRWEKANGVLWISNNPDMPGIEKAIKFIKSEMKNWKP